MLPCPWSSGAVIEISLCSSPPPPRQLPRACLLFFIPPPRPAPLLLFPSVVCCQPGLRRKSKLKRQMRAVRLQGWGGKERAASPPALPAAGGGAARHTRAPIVLGPRGRCLFLQHSSKEEKSGFGEKTSFAVHSALCGGRQNVFATCAPSPTGDSVVTAFGRGYIPVQFLRGCLDLRWRVVALRQQRQTVCLVSKTGGGAGEARITAATAC